MALDTKIQVGLTAALTSALDLVTSTSPLSYPKVWEWADGTGADQADKVWSDSGTITASGTVDIDLAGGITDAYGATITLARVKLLAVYAHTTNVNNIEVGNAAANGWTSWVDGGSTARVRVKPGGLLLGIAPDATAWPVTAGSADVLRLTNDAGSTSVAYDIVVVGASV